MNRKIIFPVIMFGLVSSVVFVLVTNEHRMAISFDSIRYISMSRNLLSGEGLLDFFNRYNADQPLLYPLLLSLISFLVRVDPLEASWILGVILIGLISLVSALILFTYIENIWLKYLGCLLLIFFLPSSIVIFWAWTEPLFILLTLSNFYFFEKYLKKDKFRDFFILCVIASLAMMTRYIGIILIPLSVFAIFAFTKYSFRERLIKSVEFSILSVLPLGVNLIANYINTSAVFGPRSPSIFTLKQNLSYVSEVLFNWYLPSFIAEHRSILLVFGVFVGVLITKKFSKVNIFESRFFQKSRLIVLFVIIHIGFLVYSATTIAFDRIGPRLLSPVFIPILLVVLIFLDDLLIQFKLDKMSQKWNTVLVVGVLVVLFISAFQDTPSIVKRIYTKGDGISSKSWRNSELAAFLGSSELESCEWYTNAPEVVYFFTGKSARWVLHKSKYNSTVNLHSVDKWIGKWPPSGEKACVIWFDRINRVYLFTPQDLTKISTLEEELKFRDGSVFYFSRKNLD